MQLQTERIGRGVEAGYYRGLYHRRVSHNLAHPMFQVAFSKQFPFSVSHCLVLFHYLSLKTNLSF